jgi:hypothetical protein
MQACLMPTVHQSGWPDRNHAKHLVLIGNSLMMIRRKKLPAKIQAGTMVHSIQPAKKSTNREPSGVAAMPSPTVANVS